MANTANPVVESVETAEHPMQKSYMFVSSRHVDYDNLTAFESITMSITLGLAVTLGVLVSVAQLA